MIGLIEILMVNMAIFFGQYIIIATALNFQYGNAGIPNMSSNISVAVGAYAVSSLVLRICIWIGMGAGLVFKPDWVYDNAYNVNALNTLLKSSPALSLSLFLLAVALALLMGSALGWGLSLISGKLRAVQLMILLFIVSEAGDLIAANSIYVAGGTLGAFVPNFLSWYEGEQMLIVALLTLTVGLVCYFMIRTMMNSPFGRLIRATKENEWTVMSTGKNVTAIRRDVMMFGSGMMAVAGVLLSMYYCYVQFEIYDRVSYTFWPWLMITIGGLGNNAGSFIGVLICVSILRAIAATKSLILLSIVNTEWIRLVDILENLLLGGLLLLFFIFKPRGLIPEKLLRIPGINYRGIVRGEETKLSE